MSHFTLIICEGAHDKKALSALLQVCAGWTRLLPHQERLPERMIRTLPAPRELRFGGFQLEQWPEYLRNGERFIMMRSVDGVDKALGESTREFVRGMNPDSFALVVDADDKGVSSRVEAFKNRYRKVFPHVEALQPNGIAEGRPRAGLWVAPDNVSLGRFDALILAAARVAQPESCALARDFVDALSRVGHAEQESELVRHREKAVLGALGQAVKPGASLAVAIEMQSGWFSRNSAEDDRIQRILAFLNALTAP